MRILEIETVKHKKKELVIILILILLLVIFFSGYSMGKEKSNEKIEGDSKIAEPILIVENNPVVELDGKKPKEYYDFKVKNYKENGEITQLDLTYNIEVLSQIDEAVSFKLYKENQEIPLNNNKTEDIKLEKGEAKEDVYRLEINYDKEKSTSVEEILQEVQIKIHSEQMKSQGG